jgi:ATP-dependent protease ClpP protease subunit
MIHQVSTIAYGKEEEFRNESEEVTRLNDLLFKILDKRCKKKRGYWKSVLKNNEFTDVFVNATDAVDTHALATHVGYPNIETEITIERTWTPPEE